VPQRKDGTPKGPIRENAVREEHLWQHFLKIFL